ncbi:uncharacterized protein G2W53_014544 [Senna tora]|uniref:Uncharacterized protein n=1 Tax=Senna tora TaxID=362788 RepID=A0A835C2S6_9FABA|nr:uncharacterized protein G2W53_014544 [Senna tora]
MFPGMQAIVYITAFQVGKPRRSYNFTPSQGDSAKSSGFSLSSENKQENASKFENLEKFASERTPTKEFPPTAKEHENIVKSQTGKRKWSKAKSHSNNFIEWFETGALNDDISDFVKGLSKGPNTVAKKFSAYVINGYRGHLEENRYYVMKRVPRDLFNMGDQADGGQEFHWGEPSDSSSNPTLPVDDGEVDLVRTAVPATIIDQPLPTLDDQPYEIDYEEDYDIDDSDWDYME